MTTEPTDIDVLSTAGAGAYVAALADGTLGQYSHDDICDMAEAVASRPGILGAMMDDADGAIAMLPPEAVVLQILDDHADAAMADERAAVEAEAEAEAARWADGRRAAMYAHSRLAPEDVGRMEFDAEQGDTSPMLALEERFYLG